MTVFRILTAGAVVGLIAVMSPQTASAGAALVPGASQAALAVPADADIVKVAEQWRGNRWNRGFGGNWHKRAHRHEWRKRAYRHKWRKRRHSRRDYDYRRGSDFGFALGATGLFFGLSALAARPHHYNGYSGYSGYRGYSGSASGSCSRYEPWSTPWYRCCSAKYRSFDPRTGTYHAYSGRERFCR